MTMSSTNSVDQFDNHMKNKEIWFQPQNSKPECEPKSKRQNNKAFSIGYSWIFFIIS